MQAVVRIAHSPGAPAGNSANRNADINLHGQSRHKARSASEAGIVQAT